MRLIPVWHGHHNTLLSWLLSIKGRIKEIETNKPKSEHALRKCLIKPVKGKLPVEYVKAGVACEKARAAYCKRRAAKVWWFKVWGTYDKALDTYDKAWEVCDKAYRKYLPEIEALHAKECPDCPWDGKSIFKEAWTIKLIPFYTQRGVYKK